MSDFSPSEDVLGLTNWLRSGGVSSDVKPDMMASDEADDQYLRATHTGGRSKNPKDWASEDAAENSRLAAEDKKHKRLTPTYTAPTSDPVIADDGQSLTQQTSWTQTTFRAQYGEKADSQWATQHNEELKRNRRLYGVTEPVTGQNPLSTSPTGTSSAPNRVIGAVAPPYTAPATSPPATSSPSYTTPTGQRLAFTPNQPYLGAQPKPTLGQIPTTLTPTGVPDNTAPNPTQIGRLPDPNDDVVITNKINGTMLSIKRKDLPRYTDTSQLPAGMDAAWSVTSDPVTDASTRTQRQSITQSTEDNTMNNVIRMSQTENLPGVTSPDMNEPLKPINYLANLHVQAGGQGANPDQIEQESSRILNGIGGLLRGDRDSAWAEPYLNDVARLAWAKENANQGKRVDPRQAPVEYIESWKDAFYGSDNSVPFVKDLDQQMIDHAVTRTPVNRPFNWQEAFGPNGESGLISRQIASNDCGTNAFATILRSRGYNADPTDAFNFGKQTGYHNGEQFNGPQMAAKMLRDEAGLDARADNLDWKTVDAELAAGRPVELSGAGHYWVVAAKRDGPNGPEYYTGATGSVVGNPEWARPDQIHYQGNPNVMITARGDVDPNSRAVQAMGLRPPGQQFAGRAALSQQTNAALAAQRSTSPEQITSGAGSTLRLSSQEVLPDTLSQYAPIVTRAANEYNVDPDLVAAVMHQENRSGDPNATSSAGAQGPMQLMPSTARSMGVQDNTNPEQNIYGGVKYLRQLLDMFNGDVSLALAAYNAGPGAVLQAGGIPDYGETKAYVPLVLQRYQQFKKGATGQESFR